MPSLRARRELNRRRRKRKKEQQSEEICVKILSCLALSADPMGLEELLISTGLSYFRALQTIADMLIKKQLDCTPPTKLNIMSRDSRLSISKRGAADYSEILEELARSQEFRS